MAKKGNTEKDEKIRQAIDVGKMVRKGAADQMDELVSGIIK